MENKQKIIQDILDTKYPEKTKNSLIDKINGFVFITDMIFLKISENLENYMKSIQEEFEKFDKIKLEVVKLERHQYAPEMNKLYLKTGKNYSTPQQKDIDSAINYVLQNYKL